MRISNLATTVAFGLLVSCAGCRHGTGADEAKDVKLDFAITPKPPKVGPAQTTIQLADEGGAPVAGATLKLEGNMNHAGMKPVFADAKETSPGKYEATLELTMGGDWFVLIQGSLADGRKLSRKVNVPGVKSR